MTTLSCICRSDLERKKFSDRHDMMKCRVCQSIKFVDRDSSSMIEYSYDSNDNKYGNESYLNNPEFRWAHLELVKQEWKGLAVLEIGCFTGFFLDNLRSLGAVVYGVEVNAQAVLAGERLYDLKDRMFSDLSEIPAGMKFDRILMIDVLEHIDRPADFISIVKPFLKEGGVISISSPTIERRFHDKSDFPPHHHWWFSRDGLQRMTKYNGLLLESADVQHDGMLLLRNFIGRALYGFSRREFNGDGSEAVSAIARSGDGTRLYRFATWIGDVVLRSLGLQYCSYMFHARNSG